jgi:2-polyprenyl-3-methyl-5-hydroxy-6-metoxy-1,4-benzoquinol methylase
MACPYCNDTHNSSSFLPSTQFNNKLFHYLKCASCGVVYINPLPDADDYQKMYPPDYQSGVDKTILKDPYKKLPGLRFSYGFQFDLIKKQAVKNAVILDYGCGNANFLINARHHDFLCDGAEFNEAHVEILKKEFPQAGFCTISEILKDPEYKFDVIRLSNVLEHLDDPNKIIGTLIERLNNKGLLLVEGPVECNSNFAFFTRKIYFKWMNFIRKGYVADHAPTHITFTTAKNQLQFFNKFGLDCIEYKISEAEWPYPESFSEAPGIGGKIKVCIAKVSILLSSMFRNSGNTFIYAGRKK